MGRVCFSVTGFQLVDSAWQPVGTGVPPVTMLPPRERWRGGVAYPDLRGGAV